MPLCIEKVLPEADSPYGGPGEEVTMEIRIKTDPKEKSLVKPVLYSVTSILLMLVAIMVLKALKMLGF